MILRQRITARTPLVAWIAILAAALLVLPGFSTGQERTESLPTANESDVEPEAASLPAVPEQPTDPAAADDTAVTREEIPPRPRSAELSNRIAVGEPITDQQFNEMFSKVHRLLSEARGKGRSLTEKERHRVIDVLHQGAQRARQRRQRDDVIVHEIYAQILGRRPTASELSRGLNRLRSEGFNVANMVSSLLGSSEFIDGVPQNTSAALPQYAPSIEPARTRQAKAQTLLRVKYDMPSEKGEALAKFLKDQVKEDHVDVRTLETGLVVTAEAHVQRTIVGIVSLMLGEPIALDLGDAPAVGHATIRVPVFKQHDNPGANTTTYFAPTPYAEQAPPGAHPPLPAAGRVLRPRTIPDPVTGKPMNVYETDDPTRPRFITPIAPPNTGNQPAPADGSPARP
jgi:hypothetical protein